jgi:hypothetical protein
MVCNAGGTLPLVFLVQGKTRIAEERIRVGLFPLIAYGTSGFFN